MDGHLYELRLLLPPTDRNARGGPPPAPMGNYNRSTEDLRAKQQQQQQPPANYGRLRESHWLRFRDP